MTKKPKAIKNPWENPLVGMLTTLGTMKEEILNGGQQEWRKDKFNDKTANGFIVDTCVGFDTGLWETGIEPSGKPWVIVEQYESREAAENGHRKWTALVTKNPAIKLHDIFVGE